MNVHAASLAGDSRTASATAAIVLYEIASESTTGSVPSRHGTMATHHEIHADENGARLGPGKIVTMRMIEAILSQMHRSPLTYIPESVVATGLDSFAWFVPAATRRMYFKPRDGQDQALKAFDSRDIPQPPLLFVARSKTNLSVYALRENTRPDLSTALMWAPMWNVFKTNHVCIGSMTLPEKINPSESNLWVDAFFRSNFSTAETGFFHSFKGTYAEMLTATIAQGAFNPAWLKPCGKTVESALCSD